MTNADLGPSLAMEVCPVALRAMEKRRVIACMGGWCRSRLSCPAYHAGDEEVWPDRISERLCPRGVDHIGGLAMDDREATMAEISLISMRGGE